MKKLITASFLTLALFVSVFAGNTPCNVYTIESSFYTCSGTSLVVMGAYENGPGISTSWSVSGPATYCCLINESGGSNGPHKEWVQFDFGSVTSVSWADVTFTVTNSITGCSDSFTKRIYILPPSHPAC